MFWSHLNLTPLLRMTPSMASAYMPSRPSGESQKARRLNIGSSPISFPVRITARSVPACCSAERFCTSVRGRNGVPTMSRQKSLSAAISSGLGRPSARLASIGASALAFCCKPNGA